MRAPLNRVVAVTGLGVLNPAGTGVPAFWAGLMAPAPTTPVRRVDGFDPARWLSRKQQRTLDRSAQLAVAAADEALRDAGLLAHPDAAPSTPEACVLAGVDPARAGVALGTGIGGVSTLEAQTVVLGERGARLVSPFTVPMSMPNAPAAALSMRYGARGPATTVTTACAAGADGIAAGARLVASGTCDVVLAGGADVSLTPTCLAGFANMRALSPSGTTRPFDARRDGLAAAEAAAVLVLEPLEAALERGAEPWATIAGAASTSDAHHLTAPAPHGAGALECMRRALHDAGVAPQELGHVNAHGTSTVLNDAAEAEALRTLLGPARVPVTSVKGVTGHAFGAAGAVEAVAVALSIRHALLPPTAGHEHLDEGMDIDVVTEPTPWAPGPVLSNSFGFGGHNGCLVVAPVP
ncbi:beta-ketoacyl-[acyl-carrier-protein] synthase family protein [Kineococcus sp. SYSU DK006]|uniref:beta-ketoacyl-[acyl-carrier-protein] synthase family protein n=1 Tax=Kineococcus sp. SYSU DK006 TaxID=3383127 RepID=UPI003D7E5DFC